MDHQNFVFALKEAKADSKTLVRTTVELESRTTQIQEGEDDEDITTIDTTTPKGQKEQPQVGHAVWACWLNSQVNLILAVQICSY
jgi:hypothetical protein